MMFLVRQGLVCVNAPDELAAVLLQDRLAPFFRCEIVRVPEGSWEVHVFVGAPRSLAAVLASARQWLEAERIAATTISVDGQTQVLERLSVGSVRLPVD
jgi:hypothetical protein